MKYKDILLFSLLSLSLVFSCYNSYNTQQCYSIETNDITDMYKNYVEDWKLQSKKAFDEAEAKIFIVPKPPVVVIPMEDPDPAKCICKGTGIITHGDGHKTPCQYHGNKQLKFKPLIILENK